MEKTEYPTYAQLEANTPPGSSWGVFADADRGTANFAGGEDVLEAAGSVTRGEVFNLDYALNAFDPPMARARRAPEHEILSAHSESRDDVLRDFFLQATSQVDGLRHRRASGYGFYNGVADASIRAGVPDLGVQAWAERPIVGRGILLDIAGLLADEGTPLEHRGGPVLEVDHLERACARQGVSVRSGDIVMVHRLVLMVHRLHQRGPRRGPVWAKGHGFPAVEGPGPVDLGSSGGDLRNRHLRR